MNAKLAVFASWQPRGASVLQKPDLGDVLRETLPGGWRDKLGVQY